MIYTVSPVLEDSRQNMLWYANYNKEICMQLLKKWLDSNGISQKEFAGMIGVAPSTVYRVITGKTRPKLDIAKKIETLTNGEVTRWSVLYPIETKIH
jgi:transcriptional regulator with XRE-family HTH domain